MRSLARIRNEQNRDASRGAERRQTEGQRVTQNGIELKRGGSQRQKIRCTFIREVRTIGLSSVTARYRELSRDDRSQSELISVEANKTEAD